MLYKGYYGHLKGVVLRYVHDLQNVEELVNDSFLKIFNGIGSFKAIDLNDGELNRAFRSWTAKIASRTAIDFLRKKKAAFAIEEINDGNTPRVYNATSATCNGAKEIMNLLNHLPETQKVIFNLYELEGFTHEEIAGFLAITESVSRSYLSRAKTKLKSLYVKHF